MRVWGAREGSVVMLATLWTKRCPSADLQEHGDKDEEAKECTELQVLESQLGVFEVGHLVSVDLLGGRQGGQTELGQLQGMSTTLPITVRDSASSMARTTSWSGKRAATYGVMTP